MNAIRVIHPYKDQGTWVFDDPDKGLAKEPFVSGSDTILDRMVEGVPAEAMDLSVFFSDKAFPGFQYELVRRREEMGGYWYFVPQLGMEGWLCPALFRYFETAPETIFVQTQVKRRIRRT